MSEEIYSKEIEEYISAVKSLASIDNFYDYEKKFAAYHRDIGKKVLEKSIVHKSEKGRKKSLSPSFAYSFLILLHPFLLLLRAFCICLNSGHQ